MINLFMLTGKPIKPIIVKNRKAVKIVKIDLFAGFGGTTLAAEQAKVDGEKVAIVAACVNHDFKALTSHQLNHPEALHFVEDVRTLNLKPLADLINEYRRIYHNAKIVLWASLECINFSKAKGGQPRDADSRTLAEALYSVWCAVTKAYKPGDSYIQMLNPDYIMIENVVEFMSWGPMRVALKKHHKENIKKGIYANSELKWCFNKKEKREELAFVPISKRNGEDFRKWEKTINSLGYRSEWRELNSADFGAYTSRNRLFGVFAKNELPIVWPEATHSKKGSNTNDLFGQDLKPWLPVKDLLDFTDEGQSIFTRKKPLSEKTLEVIYGGMLKEFKNKGNLDFLFKYYGNGLNLNSINIPAGTITTKDRFAKVCCILRDYKTGFTTSIDTAIGTIPTVPKAYLLSFILNPSHGGHCMSTDVPCATIVASQHKAPLYLSQLFEGAISQPLNNFLTDEDWKVINGCEETEKSIRVKILQFMIEHGISDIAMRMLSILELLVIQGFPADYKMFGNQGDCKRFIGNSVNPNVVKCMFESMAKGLKEWDFKYN